MDNTRKIVVVLFMAFVMILAALIGTAVAYDKNFTELSFKPHEPIFIDGDDDFLKTNGVVDGSGTESDPYVIEGWSIQIYAGSGISINDTDAHVVIRNVSIESTSYYYYGYSKFGTGLVLNSASNVRMENMEVVGFRVGVLFDGSADARCENLAISQSNLAENLFQVVARNATGLEMTRLITQPYYYDSGIQLDNCTDFDVRSCVVQDFALGYVGTTAYGICVSNSSEGRLEDNLIRSPNDYNARGIWIRNSTGICVSNNSLVDVKEMSIWAETCNNLSILNNTIEGWDNNGIVVRYSSSFLVADNKLRMSWGQSGADLGASYSENGTIRNNSLVDCGGISAHECSNILVSDNLVERGGFAYGGSGHPSTSLAVRGTDIEVSRNVVVDGLGPGISIYGDNITVVDNEVSNNCRNSGGSYPMAGIRASGTNLTIVGNDIRNNTRDGYYLESGVLIEHSENSTFRENRVSDALSVIYCSYVDFSASHFYGNWSFTFFGTDSSANISFLGNSFFDGISVDNNMMPGVLQWDAGYPTGGDYWAQYSGEDLRSGPNQNQPGADGIGDVPYQLSAGEWDNYPLMTSTAIPDLTPPTTYANLSGELGTRGWFKSSVNASLWATDTRGEVNTTYFSLDGSTWDTYASTCQISGDGMHLLEFYSVDEQGNSESRKTIELRIDTTPPFLVQTFETEYRFRGVETGYIYPEFGDNTSGLSHFIGVSETGFYGSYTMCSFLSVSLSDGTKNYTIVAIDAAGNDCSQDVTIQATVRPNTELMSLDGPYGPRYSAAVVIDIWLLIAALVIFEMSRDRPPPKDQKRGEGEKHYDEDVVDGYPKYIRRV